MRRMVLFTLWVCLGSVVLPVRGADEPNRTSFPVAIRVDTSRVQGALPPAWRFFGHDEPNYTYMRDGQKLLGELAALSPDPVYIRTHKLLTSCDGKLTLKGRSTGVYSEDEHGQPRYN